MLVCCDLYVEAFHNYKKSSYRTNKLEACAKPLGCLIPFLEQQCEGAAPSLRQVWAKTQFYMHSQEVGSSSAGFKMMLEAGLRNLVVEVADASSLELWFHTMVFEAWTDYLKTPVEVDDMAARVLRLSDDATELIKLLRQYDAGPEARVFRLVADDLWSLATLLGCWQPKDSNASEVEKASDALKEKRMVNIQKALGDHALGQHLLSKSAVVLQTSGQHIAAGAKLKRAEELLTVESLPRVVTDDDGIAVFKDRHLVMDMSVAGIFDESLGLLENAIELYSRKELGGCSARVEKWVETLLAHLHRAEECLILDLMELLHATNVGRYILEGTDMELWNQKEDVARCFAEMQLKFQQGDAPCDDTPLDDFIKRFISFLESVPVELIGKETANNTIKDSIGPFVESAKARHALVGVLRLMGDVLSKSDCTPDVLCDELKRCHSHADLQNSRLFKCVKLQEAVGVVGVSPILSSILTGVEYDVEAENEETGDIEANRHVWIEGAPLVFESLPDLAVLPHLQGVVAQSLKKIFVEVVDGSCLAGLKVPVVMPTGDTPVVKCMDACMKCTTPNGKPVEVWLKSGGDDRVWPSTLPVKAACDILEVMASRGMHVGVTPMCTCNEDDEDTKVKDLDALVRVLRLLEVIGKIGRCFAWIKTNHFGMHPTSFAVKGSINANLDKVLTAVAGLLKGAPPLLADGTSAAVAKLAGMPWIFPVDQFGYWLDCSMFTFQYICKEVVCTVVEQLLKDSVSLLGFVPTYDHLLCAKKIDLKLASTHLVKWPGKAALGSGCIDLETNLTNASAAHTRWGMEGSLRDAPSCDDKVEVIEANFLTARKALAAIAGVNCLCNLQGKARLEKRDKILRQSELLPGGLVKLLREQK